VIVPTISVWNSIIRILLQRLGFRVYYRGIYYQELRDVAFSRFLEGNRIFRKFVDASIRRRYVDKVSAIFSLNPDLLLTRGRQYVIRRFQNDFYFTYLALNSDHDGEKLVVFPASKRLRKALDSHLNTGSGSLGVRAAAVIGFTIERLILAFVTLVEALGLMLLLIYWRFSKVSKSAQEIRGSIIWVGDGAGDISLDPEKLSLPLYLKELFDFGKAKTKFFVRCGFLKGNDGWNEYHSRSVPAMRSLRPGLSNKLFFLGLIDLFKLLLYLPLALCSNDERLVLLRLLPHFFLKRAWLGCISVRAIVESNSAAGWDHALIYAARELNVPVIMVFYSANNIEVLLTDESYRDVTSIEFHEMLAEHFCVWTYGMKAGLEKLGYDYRRIHVVGPQMFAPIIKKETHDFSRQRLAKIGVIEMTPLNEKELVKRGRGTGLYNREFCLSFLVEALEIIGRVIGERSVVILKMKRYVDFSVFDNQWLESRTRHIQQFPGTVTELEPNTNPWLLINNADAIISIPFSSISEAALGLGKPAIFFDPTHKILPRTDDTVPLVSGKEKLYNWLKNLAEGKTPGICDELASMDFGPGMVASVLDRILCPSSENGIDG